MIDLHDLCAQLPKGRIELYHGQEVIRCAGPNHSANDNSLRVGLTDDGDIWVLPFSPRDQDHIPALKDWVRSEGGLPPWQPKARSNGLRRRATPAPRVAAPPATDTWRPIWRRVRDPSATPVESYLAQRGLALPPQATEVIGWHPDCPFRRTCTSCMVVLVRSVVTDAPQAIHRTAITLDGRKAEIDGDARLALGPTKGGAIKLWADAEVSTCLGVGEGIESTLSIRQHPQFAAVPVWALLDAGHLRAFPVLAGLGGLVIAVDHDPAGQSAAEILADRYAAAGAAVTLVQAPEAGDDLNDLVRRR